MKFIRRALPFAPSSPPRRLSIDRIIYRSVYMGNETLLGLRIPSNRDARTRVVSLPFPAKLGRPPERGVPLRNVEM